MTLYYADFGPGGPVLGPYETEGEAFGLIGDAVGRLPAGATVVASEQKLASVSDFFDIADFLDAAREQGMGWPHCPDPTSDDMTFVESLEDLERRIKAEIDAWQTKHGVVATVESEAADTAPPSQWPDGDRMVQDGLYTMRFRDWVAKEEAAAARAKIEDGVHAVRLSATTAEDATRLRSWVAKELASLAGFQEGGFVTDPTVGDRVEFVATGPVALSPCELRREGDGYRCSICGVWSREGAAAACEGP